MNENDTIKLALKTVIEKEKRIEKVVERLRDKDEQVYMAYQVIGDVINNVPFNDILHRLDSDSLGWNHPIYDGIKEKIFEHDEYIVKPFDITEGLAQCGKCQSKRTYSTQKQVRSCDEPMTTFSRCANCNHTWTYSG